MCSFSLMVITIVNIGKEEKSEEQQVDFKRQSTIFSLTCSLLLSIIGNFLAYPLPPPKIK